MSYSQPDQNAFFRFLNLYTPARLDLQLQYLASGLENLTKHIYKNKDGSDLSSSELKGATQNLLYIAINVLILKVLPIQIRKFEASRKSLKPSIKWGISLLINYRPLLSKDLPNKLKDPASAERLFNAVLKPKWWKEVLLWVITQLFFRKKRKTVQAVKSLRNTLLKFLIDHKQSFAGESVTMKKPEDHHPILVQIYSLLQKYGTEKAGKELRIGGYWNQLYATLKNKQPHIPPAYFQGLVHTAANYAINWNTHNYPNFAVTLVTATVFDKNMVPYLEDFGNNEPYRSLFSLIFNVLVLPPEKEKEPVAYQAWQDMLVKDGESGQLILDIGVRDGLPFASYLTARHYWAVLGSSAYPKLAANQIVAAFPGQTPPPSH